MQVGFTELPQKERLVAKKMKEKHPFFFTKFKASVCL
jgi:hypothetical protein